MTLLVVFAFVSALNCLPVLFAAWFSGGCLFTKQSLQDFMIGFCDIKITDFFFVLL